jgi:hypothetical protein
MARQPTAGRLKELAWYSSMIEVDIGKNGAAALLRSLKPADIPAVYKEYADIEHMTIVQAALDDVLKPAASSEERAARKAQAETNVATLAQSVDASKPDSPTQTDAPSQTDAPPAPPPPSPRRWLHQECGSQRRGASGEKSPSRA